MHLTRQPHFSDECSHFLSSPEPQCTSQHALLHGGGNHNFLVNPSTRVSEQARTPGCALSLTNSVSVNWIQLLGTWIYSRGVIKIRRDNTRTSYTTCRIWHDPSLVHRHPPATCTGTSRCVMGRRPFFTCV